MKKKILKWIGSALFVFLFVGIYFQIKHNYMFKKDMERYPVSSIELKELIIPPLFSTNGLPVSLNGLHLTLPWNNLTNTFNKSVAINYRTVDGLNILIYGKKSYTLLNGLLDHPDPEAKFLSGMSNKQLYTELLSITPKSIRLIGNPATINRQKYLLTGKSVLYGRYKTLYSFQLGDIYGFQIGGPNDKKLDRRQNNRITELILIEPNDKVSSLRFTLSKIDSKISPSTTQTNILTQSHINDILASIRIE